jgi:hypothetical protein
MRERCIGLGIVSSILFSFLSVLPLALVAHAGEDSVYSGSREVRLEHGAVFDGKVFPAGLYSLSWGVNQAQDRVEVRLYEGRRMVASATGTLERRDAPSPYDSIVFSRVRTGDRELAEIRFAGSPSVIALLDTGSAPAVAGTR